MADSLHPSTVSCPLHIFGITVDFSKSKINVVSAEARISKLNSPHGLEREAGKSLRRTFSPHMVLSREDSFSLHLRYRKGLRTKHEDIIFDTDDMIRAYNASERQEYIKFHKNINIVVDLSGNTTTKVDQSVSSGQSLELRSTTSEIFQSYPRFRILVIGKTGVGKSSLINHVFGVEKTIASHDKPGEVSIDDEFSSPQNKRFVLHDSKGFEPGDEKNLKIVQDFIERRKEMTPENQLHAVWICFEIPRADGRLLETGTDEFLTLKSSGKLGNVPVIVVFTKYDMLIDRVERTLDESSLDGLSDQAVKELIKNKAEAELQDICIRPLEKFAGEGDVRFPHATISTEEVYKETLTHLIQITEKCVGLHSAPEAAVITSIAQRVHPGLKVKASIEVGKKKYWKALASSTTFKNHKTWDCLYVLHTDIVNVWNFYDPHHYLRSQEFRELTTNIVDKLEVGPTPNPTQTMAFGLSMVGTIAGIVTALAGPAAPIVVPIAVGAVLAVWVHDVYKISRAVLQRFMAYIIHLTLVLQTLYLVSEGKEITRRAIKLSIASYLASPMSGEVVARIQEYDRQLSILERTDRDILDKIIEVMQFYSIDAAHMSDLRGKLSVDLTSDEPW
ncbi:uncharacterized protein EDB93DRAFT_1306011 [Suillus bovinus]|uniref:uncharacterized protein n=1 Tax=Suillus bovinus TaxID=48563 RepID=UPI001B87410A|nr:uncharacterized protein EDB93DRAFT_1306011 [Suillus bovinus]KAG2134598.1 hypothetical protein EDB93DRAFT_1306011 [Suillus bovinus]